MRSSCRKANGQIKKGCKLGRAGRLVRVAKRRAARRR